LRNISYNGTGAAVNLATAGYNVQMYFNGVTTAGLTINLTGTVADGDVFVLAQSSATAAILAQADQTNGSSWYNGDDAIVLRQGSTIIDVIGQVGFDPGTEWGTGLTSTADNTLRRKAAVCAGDGVSTNVFEPVPEWDGLAIDTFDGLGAHTANCGPTPSPTPTPTPFPTPTPTPSPTATPTPTPSPTPTPTPTAPALVVISQVYGGGGNSGATYKNDFIELFNRGTETVNLTGWSVQYGSSGGTTWNRTALTGAVAPGQYFLVQAAAGAGGTSDLPTPDTIGTLNLSGTNGKVALVRADVSLAGACPAGDPNLVDLVGYGGANCFEGAAAAPTLSNTTAALRARNGCKDTDYNAANFTELEPAPRNTAASFNSCPAGDPAPEIFSTSPAGGSANAALASNITVTFDEAVNVSGNWYQISCDTSGAHDATATGSSTNFTLDPTTDFVGGERCTVTVFASAVSDQDTNDPPDTMEADYTFSFNTLVVRDPAEHLVMGNPSGATTDTNNLTNYLLAKPQFALSYNCDRGTPNWTSWHLDSTWLGSAPRQDDFRNDPTLPGGCYQVLGTDYSGSGFDRGHMTPSADRTSSVPDNSATFLMTNMIPQAPDNNQGPWAVLEGEARTIVGQGNEVYIISGGVGTGGVGSGGARETIAGGAVTVPASTWKVLLVLPVGDEDVSRVSEFTRAFAVIMPNTQGIRPDDWRKYIATVDQVEALTGYDFFSNVADAVEAVIEARLDTASNTAPVAHSQMVTTAEDNGVEITLSATDANVNNELTYTIVTNPQHGTLSGTGHTLTYTPEANYHGADSFTFKASDGGTDSNTATVTVNVTAVPDAPAAQDDTANINEDSGANPISVLANDTDADGDSLTVTAVTPGSHGSVAITEAGTGLSYTPQPDFFGADSFSYTVSDGQGGTDTKTVSVTIANVNDAPAATGEAYRTNSNTRLSVSAPTGVLANDADMEGDSLAAQLVSNVSRGTLALNADGSFVYMPNPDFAGTDTFTYRAFDGAVGSNTVSVTITVNDTVAPALTSAVATTLLSQTNSNLVNVGLTASATDNSGGLVAIGVQVFGDEDDEAPTVPGVVHSPDAKDIAPNTLRLRAERVEANDGRVYIVVVTATDPAGNVSRNYHTVVVPKNNKQASINSVNAQAAQAVVAFRAANGAIPPGYFVVGDGAVVGPKQ